MFLIISLILFSFSISYSITSITLNQYNALYTLYNATGGACWTWQQDGFLFLFCEDFHVLQRQLTQRLLISSLL